jgi:hypothetical protein
LKRAIAFEFRFRLAQGHESGDADTIKNQAEYQTTTAIQRDLMHDYRHRFMRNSIFSEKTI